LPTGNRGQRAIAVPEKGCVMRMRLSVVLGLGILSGMLALACSSADESEPNGGERVARQTADLVSGSCSRAHACNGRSKDGCWCDSRCWYFGDCCADAAELCGRDECRPWWDSCGEGYSCVAGHPNTCEPERKFCGGIAAFPCDDGFVCIDNPDDGCDPQHGGADCGGICVPECAPGACGPQLGMPNWLCDDGVTVAGPTGNCLPNAEGTCGWEVITCSDSCPTTCGEFCPMAMDCTLPEGCQNPGCGCPEAECSEPKCPTTCGEFCPMAMDCTLPEGCQNPGCGCPQADCG